MKSLIFFLISIIMALNCSACTSDKDNSKNGTNTSKVGSKDDNGITHGDSYKVKITVGNTELTATFDAGATSQAFREMLPVTLPMLDLYGREMCYRFQEALPTDNVSARVYEVGEIIYWPPGRSFVIMYLQNGERISMQGMGKIESGVEVFRNIGDVEVRFELLEN